MLKFFDGLGFDLADAFAGDLEYSSDLFERVGVSITDTVSQFYNFSFAIGQGFQHFFDSVFEHFRTGGHNRAFGRLILDKVSEVAVFGFTNRPVEADRMA